MSNLNIEQLKEFFEFRATTQDEKIKNIEQSIEGIEKVVNSVASKVNIIWGAITVVGGAALTALVKILVAN